MNWLVRGSNYSCVILVELKLRCRGLESVFTAHQIRLMDQMLIDEYGIPGLTLMSRAADASVDLLRKRYPLAGE